MKFPLPLPFFGPLTLAVSLALLASLAECPADDGAFDPSLALHFDAPVFVGTYAFDVERVFGTQTQTIRRKATKYQRMVAEANARAYMEAQLHALGGSPSSKPGKNEGAAAKNKGEPQNAKDVKAKLPRYVAVDTVKDSRSVPGTKKDVMIWDTRAESLVDNNVYDVSNPPPVGSTEQFDTYSAQYVGGKSVLPEIAERPPDAGPLRH